MPYQQRRVNIPAAAIRQDRGLSLDEAARRGRISPRRLRWHELHGFPEVLILRMATVYGCRIDDFLPRRLPRDAGG